MDKKSGPQRTSGKTIQAAPGSKAKADSKQAGAGSERRGLWINERGEVCYGDECVTLAVDEERSEIRVNVKRSATCDVEPLVQSLRELLLAPKGARTVYEIESEYKDKPKDE